MAANVGLPNFENDLKRRIHAALDPDLLALGTIWREVGFDEAAVAGRVDAVTMHLAKYLNDMTSEEQEMADDIRKKVYRWTEEIKSMSSDLDVPTYRPPSNSTLYQLSQLLPVELKKLKEERKSRMEEMDGLLALDEGLATRLGLDGVDFAYEGRKPPSKDNLKYVQDHVASLKKEEHDRQTSFVWVRTKILEVLEDLGATPGAFSEDVKAPPEEVVIVLNEDEDVVSLTDETLKNLKDYKAVLERVQKHRRSKLERLQRRYVDLWSRLDLDEDEREAFVRENKGCRTSVIENYEAQVLRLEQLRVASLERFTAKIRDEIRIMWDKCRLSDDERNAFARMEDDKFTEELLDAHEAEVSRLRDFYDQRLKLFVGLESWDAFWEQFVEFEKRANDPNRFSRRGGGLLQEEKERKKFASKFPKLEKELDESIATWENENPDPFTVEGVAFKDYVKARHARHELEKQQEKEDRLKKREKGEPVVNKSKSKTPTKRRMDAEKNTSPVEKAKSSTKKAK